MIHCRLTMVWLSIMVGSAAYGLPYDHWLASKLYNHYSDEGRYLFEHRLMTEAMRAEYQRKQTYWGNYMVATDLTCPVRTRMWCLNWLKTNEP